MAKKIRKVKGIAVRRKIESWGRSKHYSKERIGKIRGAVVNKIRKLRSKKRRR